MVGQNYVVHLDKETGRFVFAPWDLDRAFGNFFVPDPEQLAICKAWAEDNRVLNRVMSVPAVREAYTQRMEEFQKTIFEPAHLARRIDEIAAMIRPAVAEEGPEKAERFDRMISDTEPAATPEPPAGPFGFRMPAPRRIKAFIQARHQSVSDQLAGKAEGKTLSAGFPRPPGGGGPGGTGGRGPGGGGRGFGLGGFLGPVWTKAADGDGNGQVSAAEFQALSARWSGEWDSDKDLSLNEAELREGLGKAFPPPNFGQPPAVPGSGATNPASTVPGR
jgi:hypothetical protein